MPILTDFYDVISLKVLSSKVTFELQFYLNNRRSESDHSWKNECFFCRDNMEMGFIFKYTQVLLNADWTSFPKDESMREKYSGNLMRNKAFSLISVRLLGNGEAFYRPRERVGKGFTHVCLSISPFVCQMVIFELIDLLTAFLVCY